VSKFLRTSLPLMLFLLWLARLVSGQGLSTASPEEIGLSSERLERIGAVMQKYVDENQLAGAVIMVARHGKAAYLETFGMMDIEAKKPMRIDTIFRLASMSKAITSTAVMMLYEEGHFLLSDPISKYIPEFKNAQVIVPNSPGDVSSRSYSLVPAHREITIRHLLNHTSGLTYQWNQYLGEMYFNAGITHGLIQDESTIGEKVKILAGLPLLHHPGEAFEYGLSVDVLGYLVEVVSGMTLDEFFQNRIFKPLGMKDTFFFIPEGKLSRLATVYRPDQEDGISRLPETPVGDAPFVYSASYPYRGPRSYFSGGGGLCSTISDYVRFCQMMLNGGELDGIRLLSRKTVELMTTNSIGDLYIDNRFLGDKFGLGFGIRTERGQYDELESIGTYMWGGFWNTFFWIDPREELICIIMSQLYPNNGHGDLKIFRVLASQSIID